MASDPTNAYKDTQIHTASREQILLMLYEGAIRFMKQAKAALEEKDFEIAHNKIIRAQDIVTELMASLDLEVMGDVGNDLYRLYDYALHNLVQGNVDKETTNIDEAIKVMEQLQEAWDTVINKQGMTYEKAKKQVEQAENKLSDSSKKSAEQKAQPAAKEESEEKPKKPSELDDPPYGDLSIQG